MFEKNTAAPVPMYTKRVMPLQCQKVSKSKPPAQAQAPSVDLPMCDANLHQLRHNMAQVDPHVADRALVGHHGT
jgi:hypothetical protein